MNNVSMTGKLETDAELKYTPSGVSLCTLRIACERPHRTDQYETVSDYFTVKVWRDKAETAANLRVGDLVAITGHIENRSWTSQNGEKRVVTEIIANDVQALVAKSPRIPTAYEPTRPVEPDFEESSATTDDPFLPQL